MFGRFSPISFGDLHPSHYEERMEQKIILSGPVTPGQKAVMFLAGELEQSREKGQEFDPELLAARKDGKWVPIKKEAPPLTKEQEAWLDQMKDEREEYRRMWDEGLIARPTFSDFWKKNIKPLG